MPAYFKNAQVRPNITYFKFNLDFFVNIGLSFFSFVNHFSIHTIFKPFNNISRPGYFLMSVRSNYFPVILYSVVTFAGSISLGDQIPAFIILRPAIPGSSDIFMAIAQFGVFFIISIIAIIRIRCILDIFVGLFSDLGWIRLNSQKQPKVWIKLCILFCCTMIPLGISFFVGDKVVNFISMITSITCTYYIVIVPSKSSFFLIILISRTDSK